MIHMQEIEKPEIEKNSLHITKEELDRAFDARFPSRMKEKLQNASVAIAGLGGLGSNIAVSLARSGVGHLLLVDFDLVDVTNLNRQMYMIPPSYPTRCRLITGARLLPMYSERYPTMQICSN